MTTGRSCSKLWASRVLVGAGALALLIPSAALAEYDPPVVATSFEVATQSFSGFTAEREPGLAEDVADTLAALCDRHFGFLRWASLDTTGASGEASAQLILRLTGTGGTSGAFAPTISLEYHRVLSGQHSKIAADSGAPLYASYDDRPQSAASLFARICERITGELESDGFREQLFEGFLRDIPLAHEVDVWEGYGVLVFPLRWEALRVHHRSTLDLVFTVDVGDTSGIMIPGKAILTPSGQAQAGPLLCSVSEFEFGGLIHSDGWDPQIPTVLDRDRLNWLVISMMRYEPDSQPDVDGGTVTDLPQGDSP